MIDTGWQFPSVEGPTSGSDARPRTRVANPTR